MMLVASAREERLPPWKTRSEEAQRVKETRNALISGDIIEEVIPDPIPNSEVKLFGADGTARGIRVGE